VLDGKQRLLSLLRFTESADNRDLGFGLSNLEIRPDLARKKYYHFTHDPTLAADRDQFLNFTLRTVIIRNWPNTEFLHQVFLRLNTGSVTLSSQELRQAMAPGEFTTFADDYSATSEPIQSLLGRDSADPRMRDVELLVRHIAFKRHLEEYRGRLKAFLDDVCIKENRTWETQSQAVQQAAEQFDVAIRALSDIFGEKLARKPESRAFNRAIFDALSYYASDRRIRERMVENRDAVQLAYDSVFQNQRFVEAVESDTAGLPNTAARLHTWGEALRNAVNIDMQIPAYDEIVRIIRA
jgi:hypothetical protein